MLGIVYIVNKCNIQLSQGMQNVIQMALKWQLLSKKISKFPAARLLPLDPHLQDANKILTLSSSLNNA